MGYLVGLRHLPRVCVRILLLIVLALALAMVLSTNALAQSLDKPSLVVAVPDLKGPYRGAVMLAAPMGSAHIGVILNKPTKFTLAELFPEHAASQAVKDPIYFGGTTNTGSIFALVRSDVSPGPGSVMLMPSLWLAVDGKVVDTIIERTPNAARYYAGFVAWNPGEIEKELDKGWVVLRPMDKAKLFLPDTSQLYEQLAPKKGQVGV